MTACEQCRRARIAFGTTRIRCARCHFEHEEKRDHAVVGGLMVALALAIVVVLMALG